MLPVGDTTPPSTPVVTDDGDYTSSTSQLRAVWSASDPESDIAEYQYAIRTSVGGTEIVDWTSAGPNTQVIATGLTLASGETYYFCVRAKNSAGLWSDVGGSDGITVDTSPPEVHIKALGTAVTGDNTPTLIGTAFDDISPIAFVQYRIDGGAWTPAIAFDGAFDSPTEDYIFTTAALSDSTHTVETGATDAAGNGTPGGQYASASFTVDAAAPTVVETSPQDGDQNVAVDSAMIVTFSEAMKKSSAESAFSISPIVGGTFSWTDNVMTFVPVADLDYGTTYTITISAAAEDLARNHLQADYSWSFTTEPGLQLRIAVTLQGRPAPPNDQWIIPVDVWLHAPDAPWTEAEGHGCLYHFDTQTSNGGIIELMVVPGTYDIRVKGRATLKNLASGVEVNPPGPVEVSLGTLIEGDVNGDNMVTGLDYSAVIMCFGYEVDDPTAPGPTPMCDFNNDGYVTGLDYSAVIMNFGLGGADIE